jgi:hypothetical protein
LTEILLVIDSPSLRAPEDDERASLVGIFEAESVAIGRDGSQESERWIVDEAARRSRQENTVFYSRL